MLPLLTDFSFTVQKELEDLFAFKKIYIERISSGNTEVKNSYKN